MTMSQGLESKQTSSKPYCDLFEEFGTDPNLSPEVAAKTLREEFGDDLIEMAKIIAGEAIDQSQATSWNPHLLEQPITEGFKETFERGKYAKDTINRLGCGACVLAEVCPITQHLDDIGQLGEMAEQQGQLAYMLGEAPYWLRMARIKKKIDQGDDINPEPTLKDMEDLLVDIRNTELKPLSIGKTPGLKNMETLRGISELPGQLINSLSEEDKKNGIEVYDATGFIGYENMPEKAKIILLEKFASLCMDRDEFGTPMVESPTGKITKLVKAWQGEGEMFEVRIGGSKNRLYYLNLPNDKPSDSPKVVLLGGHGGNDDTQNKFINRLSTIFN